jgi:hypothetical protein
MSTKLAETMIQFGSEDKRDFAKRCRSGDLEFFTVHFPVSFSSGAGLPTVIVTPSDYGLPRFNGAKIVPAVGVVQDVTRTGFRLAAWNTGTFRGPAGFNWMAVQETPGDAQKPVDIRAGVVQPKHFAKQGYQDWTVSYRSFREKQTSLLTATNLYGTPKRNAAVVGIATDEHVSGFFLHGRNTDSDAGDCAFYYTSVATGEEGHVPADAWVETGGTGCANRELGAWEFEEVMFANPFLTPPVVLLTGGDNIGASPYRATPMVAVARYVTTHGFTLAMRNAGCKRGVAGVHWVALGCGRHCLG